MDSTQNPLIPNRDVYKFLFSSPSGFYGRLISNDVCIVEAHSSSSASRDSSRNRASFILSFLVENQEPEPGLIIPNYSFIAERICSCLSVLYGKRIDCHGMTESYGFFMIPDFSSYSSLSDPQLPINSKKPRSHFSIDLDISAASIVIDYITNTSIKPEIRTKIDTAFRFYMLAIQSYESDPEIAYLNLITCGEVISSLFEFDVEQLLDEDLKSVLSQIEEKLERGKRKANLIKSRISGIKKSFTLSLLSLIDSDFFDRRTNLYDKNSFTKDNVEGYIKSAYDLRSKYVHTGVHFGSWIIYNPGHKDFQHGSPHIKNRELAKTLANSPSLQGLERIIRYCLLNYMKKNNFFKNI